MLVLRDRVANAILLPINPFLFRPGEVAIVRGHVLLLTPLHLGFAVFQVTGLSRVQGAIADALGDALLLAGLAAVYLIHPGMARIDNAGSGA